MQDLINIMQINTRLAQFRTYSHAFAQTEHAQISLNLFHVTEDSLVWIQSYVQHQPLYYNAGFTGRV
jgi:hypothetical protein